MTPADAPLTGTCHCGAVSVTIPRRPEAATNCNCSVCRRYATLWGYFPLAEVSFKGHPGQTDRYSWGEKGLYFVRCKTCGCVTHWEPVEPKPDSRAGINLRNFDAAALGTLKVRFFDGAGAWTRLGEIDHAPNGFSVGASLPPG
ncbi:MAG: GFA family protein [Burkholderiales bacterium]|nr:GFA family protein [Burkholderiales bacterium]